MYERLTGEPGPVRPVEAPPAAYETLAAEPAAAAAPKSARVGMREAYAKARPEQKALPAPPPESYEWVVSDKKPTISLIPHEGGRSIEKPAVFIRAGDPPVDAKGVPIASTEHAGGVPVGPEAGVSVYTAWHDPKTGKYVVYEGGAQQMAGMAGMMDRPLYVVESDVIMGEVGADMEDLLVPSSVKKIRKISADDVVGSDDPRVALSGRELSADEIPQWDPSTTIRPTVERKLLSGSEWEEMLAAPLPKDAQVSKIRRAWADGKIEDALAKEQIAAVQAAPDPLSAQEAVAALTPAPATGRPAIKEAYAKARPEVVAAPAAEEVPLGISRPPVRDVALEGMAPGAFGEHWKNINRHLSGLERRFDEDLALERDPAFRRELAEAQDEWAAADMERFRRDIGSSHPESIFDRLLQLRPNSAEDRMKMQIVVEEMAADPDPNVLRQLEAEFVRYGDQSADHAEVAKGMLEDIKKVQPAPAPATGRPALRAAYEAGKPEPVAPEPEELPPFEEWVEPYLKPRKEGVTYWDDMSEEAKGIALKQREEDIVALFDREFPFEAKFGEEDVIVLGPQSTFFPPGPDGSIKKTQWVRIERPDGSMADTTATSVIVDGQPLVTKSPPRRVGKERISLPPAPHADARLPPLVWRVQGRGRKGRADGRLPRDAAWL